MDTTDLTPIGSMPDGTPVHRVVLRSRKGSRLGVITYGAIIDELSVPDRVGRFDSVILGADTLSEYLAGFPAPGALIGRVANRIAEARFSLNGQEYHLPVNHGRHHLHGGPAGFGRRVWQVRQLCDLDHESFVEFLLCSPDGDQGYPGAVVVTARYTLSQDDTLTITYSAVADRATPVSLTSHVYFNLSGGSDVLDHILWLDAEHYTPVDDELIPTGEIAPVSGTALDFTTPACIGDRLGAFARHPGGYDHNFVLRRDRDLAAPAGWLLHRASGRRMTFFTSEPGVQLYSGNFLSDFHARGGRAYRRHGGVCLECQHFPNSVNEPAFPSVLVAPGRSLESTTSYRFEVVP